MGQTALHLRGDVRNGARRRHMAAVGIRGWSVLCAAAADANALSDAVLHTTGDAIRSACRTVPDEQLQAVAGLGPREVKRMDRFSLLAVSAARAALRHAALSASAVSSCGIVTGNTLGGWTFTEPQLRSLHGLGLNSISPYLASAWFPAAAQGQVTIRLGLGGFAKTVATGRCAGAHALALAAVRLEDHPQAPILAGGAEAPVTPFVRAAYARQGHDANVLAEGAAYVVLGAGADAPVHVVGHASFARRDGGLWLRERLAIFLEGLEHSAVPTIVVGNVPPGPRAEEEIGRAVAGLLAGVNYQLLLPNRIVGETLAASGPIAAVLACNALSRKRNAATAVIVSLGDESVVLLCLANCPPGKEVSDE
jgi:hypothetical protein